MSEAKSCFRARQLLAVRAGIERRNDAAPAGAAVRRCPGKLLRRQKFSRGRYAYSRSCREHKSGIEFIDNTSSDYRLIARINR